MQPSPDPASLDQAALKAIRELDPDGKAGLLQQVIEMYLQASPPLISQIESGLASGNADSVRIAAHTLKSSSANLGAQGLAQTCGALESAARSGSLAGHAATAARLRPEFESVRRALEGEIGKSAA
jgi:HPt (histidine-containing phosphotransfer) domain-containing protein